MTPQTLAAVRTATDLRRLALNRLRRGQSRAVPTGRPVGVIALLLTTVVLTAANAVAGQGQVQGRAAAGAAPTPVISPLETQRLFDAYVLVQAQDALGVSDAQFPEFVTKLRALQEVRRRNQQARHKIVLELQRLTNPNAAEVFDEVRARDLLRSLSELEARGADEMRKAQEALDQTLDVRQQARLRVFEEQVERRKLDLLLRARRATAARENPPLRKNK